MGEEGNGFPLERFSLRAIESDCSEGSIEVTCCWSSERAQSETISMS